MYHCTASTDTAELVRFLISGTCHNYIMWQQQKFLYAYYNNLCPFLYVKAMLEAFITIFF